MELNTKIAMKFLSKKRKRTDKQETHEKNTSTILYYD